MNNTMPTETPNLLSAALQQMISSPASAYVLIGLSVIAYVCELWPKFPSRFVPIVCILGGPICYPFFCRCSSVPSEFPNCWAVLVVNGLVAGLMASAAHQWIIKWILSKIAPPPPQLPPDGASGTGNAGNKAGP